MWYYMTEHRKEDNMGDQQKWIEKNKYWSSYPIGTMAKRDDCDDVWTKTKDGWQCNGIGKALVFPPYCVIVLLPSKKER